MPPIMKPLIQPSRHRRRFVHVACGVGSAVLLGVLSLYYPFPSPPPEAPESPRESKATPRVVSPATKEVIPDTLSTDPAVTLEPPARRPMASVETRQWVEALGRTNSDGTPLSWEQAAAWKQQWQALVQQGAAGLPAIRDFLELNEDIDFGPADSQILGYSSVRNALFDAIRQIGGPEGTEAALTALRRTADPREILTWARHLESMAEGEHRQPILDSVRQALAMAKRGELAEYDVGPLFEVLQKYGGSAARPDLEEAARQWKYYGVIGLANLPEGEGIPSLIRMATEPSSLSGLAVELLAQVSLQYPEARTVVLDQVSAGKIIPNQWPYLASVLSGECYQLPDALWFASQNGAPIDRQKTTHIGFGNQNFYKGLPPGGVSPDQVARQLALVEEIAATTPDATAKAVLQTARDVLNQRLSRLTTPLATSSP